MKKRLAFALVCTMALSLAACGDSAPPASSSAPAPPASQPASVAAEPADPLSLPLYDRFYLDEDELVLVRDDGSVFIDLGAGNEERTAAIQTQADATGKKWAGVLKASWFERSVWLLSTDRLLYEISDEKATVRSEDVVSFCHYSKCQLLVHGDGTVELMGERSQAMPDISGVSEWTDIVRVALGYTVALGLKEDGTVVAVGDSSKGQAEVSGWTDIVQLAVVDSVSSTNIDGTEAFVLGLKEDGTLVAAGQYYFDCDISSLLAITDVKQIACERNNIVLVKNDGTVTSDPGKGLLEDVSDMAAIGFDWDMQMNYIYVTEDGSVVLGPDAPADNRTGLSLRS